jgi:hypothetical protein
LPPEICTLGFRPWQSSSAVLSSSCCGQHGKCDGKYLLCPVEDMMWSYPFSPLPVTADDRHAGNLRDLRWGNVCWPFYGTRGWATFANMRLQLSRPLFLDPVCFCLHFLRLDENLCLPSTRSWHKQFHQNWCVNVNWRFNDHFLGYGLLYLQNKFTFLLHSFFWQEFWFLR